MDARLLGFLNVKDSLTIHDDLIYKGSCLVIPEELRHIALNEIHRDHLGIEKTKAYARTLFYWPAITVDIENKMRTCHQCLTRKSRSANRQE